MVVSVIPVMTLSLAHSHIQKVLVYFLSTYSLSPCYIGLRDSFAATQRHAQLDCSWGSIHVDAVPSGAAPIMFIASVGGGNLGIVRHHFNFFALVWTHSCSDRWQSLVWAHSCPG